VFLGTDGSVRGKHEMRVSVRSQFGKSLAGPGDLDGDGVPDLLMGASDRVDALRLERDGSWRTSYTLLGSEQRFHPDDDFAPAIACRVPGASGPLFAVTNCVGRAPLDQHSEDDDRDAFVWFFSIDGAGQAVPW